MPRRRAGPRIVTLTSDIGWAYAAQMKAVLAATLSADRIFDLAHDLPAHGVGEGAFLLRAMAERFPPGTVHLCVIDPGVGGRRAPVAVRCRDGSFLVGPDNGVLVPLAERLGIDRVVRIDPAKVAASHRTGTTFDGRDLFAPAVGLLADGAPLSRLGGPWTLRPFLLPVPRRRGSEIVGEVLHADRFGNLITNIPTETLPATPGPLDVRLGRRRLRHLPYARSYEELGAGDLGLLPSSFGLLELAVAQGSAAERLRGRPGHVIAVSWGQGKRRNRSGGDSAHNSK